MAEEQAVVTDAEAEHDVQLAPGPVEQLGLRDRVAHGLVLTRSDLLIVAQPQLLLGHSAVLARDRRHLESVRLEDAAERAGEIHHADAGRDADLRDRKST